jgi:hypothetical protein
MEVEGSYESENYLIEIDYETWKKIMEEIIEYQKFKLSYCMNKLEEINKLKKREKDDLIISRMEEYYKQCVYNTLDTLIYNEDFLNLISKVKEKYRFFVDLSGTPHAILYPETLKKIFRNNKQYII